MDFWQPQLRRVVPRAGPGPRGSSLEALQGHLEDQRGPRGDDAPGTTRTVSELRRAGQQRLLAHLHACNTLVPARDDLAHAQRELEGGAAGDGGVKHTAVREAASVVGGHSHATGGIGARATAQDLLDQTPTQLNSLQDLLQGEDVRRRGGGRTSLMSKF